MLQVYLKTQTDELLFPACFPLPPSICHKKTQILQDNRSDFALKTFPHTSILAAFFSNLYIRFEQMTATINQRECDKQRIYPTFQGFLYLTHPPDDPAKGNRQRSEDR